MTASSTKGARTSEDEGGGGEGSGDQESEDLGLDPRFPTVSHLYIDLPAPLVPWGINGDNMHENTQKVAILYRQN